VGDVGFITEDYPPADALEGYELEVFAAEWPDGRGRLGSGVGRPGGDGARGPERQRDCARVTTVPELCLF
jgi:hypothetical protein